MATLNDSVTSFPVNADVSIGMEMLLFAICGRFVQGVPLYRTISLSFSIKSHVHHAQSHALPRKHRRMYWNCMLCKQNCHVPHANQKQMRTHGSDGQHWQLHGSTVYHMWPQHNETAYPTCQQTALTSSSLMEQPYCPTRTSTTSECPLLNASKTGVWPFCRKWGQV